MAFNTQTHLLFLILFLSIFPLKSLSWSAEESEKDFKKWLSWNIEDYSRKAVVGPKSVTRTNGGQRIIDVKLRMAEERRIKVSVSQDGSGDFMSIGEALDSIPKKNTRRVVLDIKPGVYREKIVILKSQPFITFLGDVESPPTITGNDTASEVGKDGIPLKTFHSATVAVNADYFIAANIKFENTAPHPDTGSIGGQAVAVRISGNKAAFYDCGFYGNQDTLYDHKGLHYFNNCFIQGSVDFIFGYGRSLYENCFLNSITKKVASLTAQKRTTASLASGFSFINSVVTGSGMVYLGRAWGDYSRVVFSYTFMDKVVIPQGWNDWGIQKRDLSVYYGEYKCSGPGANSTGRVHWARLLTDEEVKPFIGTHYIDGKRWLLGP
ncbi:probable pectinesterase 53 [Magnolia sinica]|uniref:probable pectinesterase 53 n=1 Tax=Magnolia sinica TaxID=86752 RepID=UPI0026597371|nr:probable pectinesterase 53 [Magnolia sinica]